MPKETCCSIPVRTTRPLYRRGLSNNLNRSARLVQNRYDPRVVGNQLLPVNCGDPHEWALSLRRHTHHDGSKSGGRRFL